jgi:GntR family transcriptional regulator, arabinose operon transcriptional repressor
MIYQMKKFTMKLGDTMSNDQTLYMQIYNYLKEKIDTKQLLPGDQLPTELELSEKFGVSRITSKKAVEQLEKEGLVNRKRGKGTYVEMNTPRTINSGMNKVISIIFPYGDDSKTYDFVMAYINGASSYLSTRGYYLSIHYTGGEERIERELLKNIPNSGIGGIIYYPESNTRCTDILSLMYYNKYPIVTIDKYLDGIPLSSVISDNLNGQYMLTDNLIRLGHRRIAYLSCENIGDKTSIRDRYFGYCKALKDNRIEIDSDISLVDFHGMTNENERKDFLKKKLTNLYNSGVTAILAENDVEAVQLMKVIHEMGLLVPKDISIAGFDGLDWLGYMDYKLTTVKQNFFEIGRRAAETIVTMIEKGDENIRHAVPTELVTGNTTDKPQCSNNLITI